MNYPSLLKFVNRLAANSSNLGCVAQFLQTLDGCRNNVLRVVGTQALGTDVLDACHFYDCTDCAAGDNAGTGSSRLQQDAARAKLADYLVRDGGALQADLNQVLLCVLDALADSVRNFGSLTKAETDSTLLVADYYESRELEDTAALDGLRYSI